MMTSALIELPSWNTTLPSFSARSICSSSISFNNTNCGSSSVDKSYHILLDSPGEKAVYHGMKPQIIVARLLLTGVNWCWPIGNMDLFCGACNVSWNVNCACRSPDYDHYLSLQQIVFVNHGNTCQEHRSPRQKHALDQGMARAHGNCGYASASLAKRLHLPKFDSVR
jgi:hypothetical protein